MFRGHSSLCVNLLMIRLPLRDKLALGLSICHSHAVVLMPCSILSVLRTTAVMCHCYATAYWCTAIPSSIAYVRHNFRHFGFDQKCPEHCCY